MPGGQGPASQGVECVSVGGRGAEGRESKYLFQISLGKQCLTIDITEIILSNNVYLCIELHLITKVIE